MLWITGHLWDDECSSEFQAVWIKDDYIKLYAAILQCDEKLSSVPISKTIRRLSAKYFYELKTASW